MNLMSADEICFKCFAKFKPRVDIGSFLPRVRCSVSAALEASSLAANHHVKAGDVIACIDDRDYFRAIG